MSGVVCRRLIDNIEGDIFPEINGMSSRTYLLARRFSFDGIVNGCQSFIHRFFECQFLLKAVQRLENMT